MTARHALAVLAPAGLVLLAAGAGAPGGSAVPTTPPPRGTVDTFTLAAPGLTTASRQVRVYLPPGYAAGTARYPVLYMHDGQNLFTPGPFGDWRMDEVVDSLIAARAIAPLMVVGVDNGPGRWSEYGPWANPHMLDWVDIARSAPVEGGLGPAYVDFLVGTVKPAVDARYRTMPDRAHTGIGGSSMGGLISLYAGLARPDVFSRVLAMSSAVWQAENGGPWLSGNQLLAYVRSRPAPRNVRVYLDVGTNERSSDTEPSVTDSAGTRLTYSRAYVEGTQATASALRAQGVPASRLRVVVEPGAIHHESSWSRRLGPALVWLLR